MNINNLKCCITHEDATIRSFMRNPSRAEDLLNEAINDADMEEVRIIWRRLREARSRMSEPVLEAAMA